MDNHWRNTQKAVRFAFLDARSFLGFLLFLVHARPWTLVVALVILFFFWVVERRGLTFESAGRSLRVWLLGSRRPGTSRRVRRKTIEYT